MIGEKYGRWTVVAHAESMRRGKGRSRRRCLVRCVCGQERELYTDDLVYCRSTGCKSYACRLAYVPVLVAAQNFKYEIGVRPGERPRP